MAHGNKITKTYIIDESLDSSVFIVSACTAVHTNALYSCSGDTSIFLTSGSTIFNGGINVNGNISGNTFYGDGSQLNNVNNFYVTGGTYDNGNSEITLTRNDGGNVVIDLSTLDLNDTVITGGTFNNSNQEITFTDNDGGSFTIDLSSLDINDTFVTGGTYDNNTAVITFTNNDGGTFDVDLSSLDLNDTFVTGTTFDSSNDTLTLSRNDGTDINETINNFNNLTANSISATTISATTFYGDGSNLDGIETTFSGLTDTDISGLTEGDIVEFNGNKWVNKFKFESVLNYNDYVINQAYQKISSSGTSILYWVNAAPTNLPDAYQDSSSNQPLSVTDGIGNFGAEFDGSNHYFRTSNKVIDHFKKDYTIIITLEADDGIKTNNQDLIGAQDAGGSSGPFYVLRIERDTGNLKLRIGDNAWLGSRLISDVVSDNAVFQNGQNPKRTIAILVRWSDRTLKLFADDGNSNPIEIPSTNIGDFNQMNKTKILNNRPPYIGELNLNGSTFGNKFDGTLWQFEMLSGFDVMDNDIKRFMKKQIDKYGV